MSVTFLHTADWQLGKPFAWVADPHKRSLVQQERLQVLQRMADVAKQEKAEFILVAGDLFDSPNVSKATVSAACSAIGKMGIPVYAIPGNHDHGGPGGLWAQDFFKREWAALAPNLEILLEPAPVELEHAVLFPCPLSRRHESTDLTAWLRSALPEASYLGEKARIVLAHGSVQSFGSAASADLEEDMSSVNHLDLSKLLAEEFDYAALGDWHGAKQVGPKAWYAGTPEPDRFSKGEDYLPGQVLVVTARRGIAPQVKSVNIGRIGWHQTAFEFTDDESLARLEQRVAELTGDRAQQDLLQLTLGGSLSIEATSRLEKRLEAWEARLLQLRVENDTDVAPSAEEITALTQRGADPLIARVANQLVARLQEGGERGAIARVALRELHALAR